MYGFYNVGVVIPALNEELSVGKVVSGLRAQKNSDGTQIVDHVVVCDNGSSDQTAEVAERHGAHVVIEAQRGYGRACLSAIDELNRFAPDIVVFIDGDNSFDPNVIDRFLATIKDGADLVIGSRTKGRFTKGALSLPQRFGNGLATWLIRFIWGTTYSDLGPYRAIRYSALKKLNMVDEAFGWTVEMQVKAIQLGLKIREIPVNTRNRLGKSRISGTLGGVIKAGHGILSTLFKLRIEQHKLLKQVEQESR